MAEIDVEGHGVLEVPDDFRDWSIQDQDALIEEAITSIKGKATSIVETGKEKVNELSESEAAQKAKDLAAQGKKELEQTIKELDEAPAEKIRETTTSLIETAAEGAGSAGSILGTVVRNGIDWLKKALESVDLEAGLATVGKGVQLQGQVQQKQGEQALEFIKDHGSQIASVATDAALLYLVWTIPLIPPQIKFAATIAQIEKSAGVAILIGPSIIKFIYEFSRSVGIETSEVEVEKALNEVSNWAAYHPRLVFKEFVYKVGRKFKEVQVEGFENLKDGLEQYDFKDPNAPNYVVQMNRGGLIAY